MSKAALSEKEIQNLEGMSAVAFTDHLSAIPHERLQEKFAALLQTYRIAARVANAAWRFNKACEDPYGETLEPSAEMYRTLAVYSPQNWLPPVRDVDLLIETLEDIYTEIDVASDGNEEKALTIISEKLYTLRQQEEARKAALERQQVLPHVSAQRVARRNHQGGGSSG